MKWAALLLALLAPLALAGGTPPRQYQDPTLSRDRIAFAYAGMIWTVPRAGGAAQRLVQAQGRCSHPAFSPDGAWLAFTSVVDGNADVYVVPAAGGEPRRLTYHPGPDLVAGWTPDSRKVLFHSLRATPRDLERLFTIPVTGGHPEALPLPSGSEGSYQADGSHLAYVPHSQWQPAWKRYRGGQTTPIWIADLADSSIKRVPRTNSNDRNPMWIGGKVYFLSDREGAVTLFAYDPQAGTVARVLDNPGGFDIVSASAGPGAIVYHQFGALKLLDLATGQARTVPVEISADLPETRPRLARIEPGQILHAFPSPSGKRVLVEARGEILSVPAEKGDVRNLTSSPGVADRDPAWSPDGKWVAWFSDEGGEYALRLRAPDGLGPVRTVKLGQPASFFYGPRWSPDSRKLAYTDKRMNLWVLDLEKTEPVKVDADLFDAPGCHLDPAWSPDSRWLAYTRQLPNHLHAIFVYGLEDRKPVQITDGRSDAFSPRFDRNGKHLHFLAGTGTGLGAGWLDMTSMGRAITSSAYVAVLRKDLPSPLAPESDEEGAAKEEKPEAKDKKAAGPEPVRIDFDGLDQRILALPVPRANYVALETGAEGVVFLLEAKVALADEDYVEAERGFPVSVHRFDFKTRKAEPFLPAVDAPETTNGGTLTFIPTADGSKVLYASQSKWFLVGADKAPKPGEGALRTDLQVFVDPPREWRQMFDEVWRIERDFLYDPAFHGVDLARAKALYEPFLEGLGSREELNGLFREMTGHLCLGHTFVNGGALPRQDRAPVGLLGADYEVDGNRYRFKRILQGENWNPRLQSPLTQPGVNVREGEYLLAVNGRDVTAAQEVHQAFLGAAGRQTVLTVGPKADGTGARQVTVVPVDSEGALRLRTWMEDNRRLVDRLTGGRVAYVFIPDTFADGFANFNRYYFSQVDKQAAILDERFNHGGSIADFIVDQLKKTPAMVNVSREGRDVVEPAQALFGPKVMLINQMSGSGGDALPWLFRRAGVGPLVGTRTWGGLVGIGGYPSLLDGGSVTAPRWGLFGVGTGWDVENIGVAPDVEVEMDPALVRQGREPQLERAVKLVLELLEKQPPQTFPHPPIPAHADTLPKP